MLTTSWLCGISYTVLFGGSMAFQCMVNYANQSTRGFSTDYALTSFLGFCFYLFNQTIGRIDPTTDAGRVHTMDIVFAQAAFVTSSVTYT